MKKGVKSKLDQTQAEIRVHKRLFDTLNQEISTLLKQSLSIVCNSRKEEKKKEKEN